VRSEYQLSESYYSMEQKKEVRVRIAPSPTGYPHIGTIYQALFNFAYAKNREGKFLVRIEDTDRSRFVEGAEEVIFSSIDWARLPEDESPRHDGGVGPYRQSERLEIYHQYVQELLDKDKAYFAYYKKADAGGKKDYTAKQEVVMETTESPLPPASVADMPENGDWIVRMRVPKDVTITFRDEIRGDITFESKQVTEQVLLKSDKFPTYHLAVVVDDHLMNITHVVRGEEWISSTPKHILLYEYFGWEKPLFFHTPDLRNPDKSKLSKRQGHTNVNWYREEGFLPEAMVNYLALLGWTHPEEKEIFSLSEFIAKFDLKDIRAVGPVFDLPKLTWMNQQYIMSMVSR
jgi:glutamyl-tRNA synthetase